MWRCAVGEGIEQEAELLLCFLISNAHDLKDALLHIFLVDTDGTATDLVAVADDVVGVRRGLARVLIEGLDPLRLRRGEGVVHRSPLGVAQGHVAGSGGIGRRLEKRGVNDPSKGPVAFLDEVELLGNFTAGCTQQRAGRLGIAGGEENSVTGLCANVLGDALALSVGNVLGHWPTQSAVLCDGDVGEALGTALLGPVLPCIELAARLRSTAVHDYGTDVFVLEDAEGGVLEELGALDDLDVEAQIRLIGAVVLHGIGKGHARDWGLNVVADELPQLLDNLFTKRNDIVLIHEGHLHVQLGKFRLAVGAEVLIAVAARDLVVALHAGHHQQLLE